MTFVVGDVIRLLALLAIRRYPIARLSLEKIRAEHRP